MKKLYTTLMIALLSTVVMAQAYKIDSCSVFYIGKSHLSMNRPDTVKHILLISAVSEGAPSHSVRGYFISYWNVDHSLNVASTNSGYLDQKKKPIPRSWIVWSSKKYEWK